MVNQPWKYTIWFNFRVYIWFSCLVLYTGSINCLLITFSKVTVRFKIQERKQKLLKWIPKVFHDICMFCNTVVMQVNSHFYIYNLSISHEKVYKRHLLICGSSLRLISSQTDVTEDHPFSKRPSLACTSASHRPPCGWFNVSLISEGPAINTNTE